MKRALTLCLLTLILVISCKSVQELPPLPDCNWQYENLTTQTLRAKQLTTERLVGSKVAINQTITLEFPTDHRIDSSGRHHFLLKGFNISGHDVGVIQNTIDGGSTPLDPPRELIVSFKDRNSDDEHSFSFELPIVPTTQFLKASSFSPTELATIRRTRGITIDSEGYLRKGTSYFYLENGKAQEYTPPNTYILKRVRVGEVSTNELPFNVVEDSNGFLVTNNGSFLVHDLTTNKVGILTQGAILTKIKYCLKDAKKTIITRGFDAKKE